MPFGVVVGGSLNRRSSPSLNSTVYGQFDDGEYINYGDQNNGWYQVSFSYGGSQKIGYVLSEYVATVGKTVVISKNDVNIRSGAGTSNASLGRIDAGVSAVVTEVTKGSDGYGWIQGVFGSIFGWIRGDMFNKTSTSGGNSGTVSGVKGNGPNSIVSAADIRAGNGIWKQDLNTTHPQIVALQKRLNAISDAWADDAPYATPDGIYGSQTKNIVLWYQKLPYGFSLASDGIVGQATLQKIESQTSQII